ncbi:ImmA/IrrE family metallo-endopeptidase [Methanobrevibacter sp. DSM 116169]|uniref:ImmA/IrrE family metallo-endopeptidase n=1 Tax=Methanobrevibacter sp. DSM 116169 TaxID=3242727 RepID=UPI0038FC89D1
MKSQLETDRLAEDLRRTWGIDPYSPINIFSIITDKMDNLTIIFMPLDDEISGCCGKEDIDYLILINSSHSKGRQNFTLAHELYHLLYEDNDEWLICSDDEYDDSEKEADNFASSLLMPNGALNDYINRNKIENWTVSYVINCEQYYQISHISMLCRLRKEKLISYDDFIKFKPDVKNNSCALGFSTDLYESSPEERKYYSLGKYIPLIEKVFIEDKISIGKKEELLLQGYRSDIVYNLDEDD